MYVLKLVNASEGIINVKEAKEKSWRKRKGITREERAERWRKLKGITREKRAES
jgi:hypothetical protein